MIKKLLPRCNGKSTFLQHIFKAIRPAVAFFLLLFISTFTFAQGGGGGNCDNIQPFCAGDESLIFANCNDQDPSCDALAEPGPDYGCLYQPRYPAWFYLQIDEPGRVNFELVQNTSFDANGNPNGVELDVDFIAWGPFTIDDDLCDYTLLQSDKQIACSYSAQAVENFSILDAQAGEIYVLVITNYARSPGFIKLGQTGGDGSTNCDIVYECSVEIDQDDKFLCDTAEFQLTTTVRGPVENYEWFKDGVLIADENSANLMVNETGTYKVVVEGEVCLDPRSSEVTVTFLTGEDCFVDPECAATFFEENFGAGTERVETPYTTYTFNGTTQIDDGQYAIVNTSAGLNTGWFSNMQDHTGDENGRMLFVNASFAPDEFYRRTITLNPNIEYTFNAWISTVYDTNSEICNNNGIPANVIFRIEDPAGNLIQETTTGDIPNGSAPNWQEYAIVFNSGENTDIQLVLINNAPGGCGNDLVIDDITLSIENSMPQISTPDNMQKCDENATGQMVFNLEDQIAIILNGQDPSLFNLTFHNSLFDAQANNDAITNPGDYTNSVTPETIYVRVEKSDEASCFSTVFFDLIVAEKIDITTDLPTQVELCVDDYFPNLDATPTNQNIDLSLVTYEWRDTLGEIVSTEGSYTPTSAGIYNVTITYAPCSEATFSIEIIVNDPPALYLGDDETLCDGATFEIVPNITGATGQINYLWSTGETTPTITVAESGTYSLEIISGACVVSDSIEIVIFDSDYLAISLGEDFKICAKETYILEALTQAEGVTYQWYLDNNLLAGETNSSIEIIFQDRQIGSSTFTVTISKEGCSESASVDVSTYDIGNCVISQGISPGTDGFNDSLDLTFLHERTGINKLQIFNRLGKMVFDQNNYINQWKGQTKDGKDLPTGTYYYVIDMAGEDSVYGSQATGWIYLNQEAN